MPRGKGIEALYIRFRMFSAGEADGAAGRCSGSCWSSNFKGIGSSYIDFTFPIQPLAPGDGDTCILSERDGYESNRVWRQHFEPIPPAHWISHLSSAVVFW